MVANRSLLISAGVEKQIEAIYASKLSDRPVGHGLIVGQHASSNQCNDHAIYLARTPLSEDIGNDLRQANISPTEAKLKIGGDNLDVEWMCEHAKQVRHVSGQRTPCILWQGYHAGRGHFRGH